MPASYLWLWDPVNEIPRRAICDADGKLIIDPSEMLEDDPTDGEVGKAPTSNWAYDIEQVVNSHKDRHDPEDGADPLDAAAPVKVGEANAEGDSHSFARANHVHEKHHTKYTDVNAVAAMGALADANPLNHDKAEEWGATEHTAIGDAAPHHTKYTNAEAQAAAVDDAAYGAGWNGVTDVAPSKNAVYNKIETLGAATKEIYFPVELYESGAGETIALYEGHLCMKMNGTNDKAYFQGFVPHDFNAISAMVVVFRGLNADATARIGVIVGRYGKLGEDMDTHEETLSDIAVTAGLLMREYDVSGVFTAITPGDYLSLEWVTDDSTSYDILGYVFGIKLTYT